MKLLGCNDYKFMFLESGSHGTFLRYSIVRIVLTVLILKKEWVLNLCINVFCLYCCVAICISLMCCQGYLDRTYWLYLSVFFVSLCIFFLKLCRVFLALLLFQDLSVSLTEVTQRLGPQRIYTSVKPVSVCLELNASSAIYIVNYQDKVFHNS